MKLYIKEENLESKGSSLTIYDEQLEKVYEVSLKENELEIADIKGNSLANVISRDSKWLTQSDIYFDDAVVASVKRDLSLFVEKRYVEPLNYEIRGNAKEHDLQIYKGQFEVVRYMKKWLTYNSAYELDIDEKEDQLIVLAVILSQEMANR